MSTSYTFATETTLTTINCGNCGATYAINERFRAKCEETGSSWTCPYCKIGWGYQNNNENARLRKQLEERERELRTSKCETMNERNLRESAERKLKRVSRGVCPCCKRHFTNLERHIASKHPEVSSVR